MDFDPDAPANIAAAGAAQAIAVACVQAEADGTLPLPPHGLPALRSVAGASVLGYKVVSAAVRDCIRPDGTHAVPGDPGFTAAQYGRLRLGPMPKGWMFEERQAHVLVALVAGNPILLEPQARTLGYSRSLATSPNTLDLGEIEP